MTSNPTLLVVDVQLAIDSYDILERSNADAERNIAHLLKIWRNLKLPIVHICHSSKFSESPYHASKPSFAFKPEVMPIKQEKIIIKSEHSAFVDTELERFLRERKIKELVICGVLTNNSIDATVRIASDLGFRVVLPIETCAASAIKTYSGKVIEAELIQEIYLSNLDNEYAEVCKFETLVEEVRKRERKDNRN